MVDGKTYVSQAITQTPSAAACYKCKTKPSDMNKLDFIEEKPISHASLSYGLSPLHILIHTMECILHITYRLKLKTSMGCEGSGEQNSHEYRKSENTTRTKGKVGN